VALGELMSGTTTEREEGIIRFSILDKQTPKPASFRVYLKW